MISNRSFSAIILALILIFTLSCSKHTKKELLSAEDSFHQAMGKFNRGKYLDAKEAFTVVTLNYSGSSIIDSAQYYLAESHFHLKEYILAAAEYERVLMQYPSSPLVDDAKYKIGLCYFKLSPSYGRDQSYTKQCVDEFQEFTEDYPQSDLIPEVMKMLFVTRTKLAKKTYKSGELYFRLSDYESALLYFDAVLDNYYDTDFASEALLKKGESLIKMKKFTEAQTIFDKLREKYPHCSAVDRLPLAEKKLQKALAKEGK
jgi:outer membrane protein assembly factor BamD